MKLLSVLLLAGIAFGQTGTPNVAVKRFKFVERVKLEQECNSMRGEYTQAIQEYGNGGQDFIYVECFYYDPPAKVAPKPEPLEVPAIHLPAKSYLLSSMSCDVDGICIDSTMKCSNNGTVVVPEEEPNHITWPQKCKDGWRWGCKDLSRILEHSEENPPKYWCRKVKTE